MFLNVKQNRNYKKSISNKQRKSRDRSKILFSVPKILLPCNRLSSGVAHRGVCSNIPLERGSHAIQLYGLGSHYSPTLTAPATPCSVPVYAFRHTPFFSQGSCDLFSVTSVVHSFQKAARFTSVTYLKIVFSSTTTHFSQYCHLNLE